MKKSSGDIDIDLLNRDDLLDHLECIPASIFEKNNIKKHNTGIYIHSVPIDPVTGFCSLDYKAAEEKGLTKLDLLNNNIYKGVRNEEHLNELLEKDINWSMLDNKEIVEKLYHIHNYYDLLQKMKPTSVEQLAMFIAVLRPGKKHLQNKSWDDIEKEIWIKIEGPFSFKRSHSFSYALAITVQMALIDENA